jgi:hypothetical protein
MPSPSLHLLLALLPALAAGASPLSVSPTLGSSGVLAMGVPLRSLWGHAAPGAAVATVLSFPGAPAVPPAVAGADGVWRAAIPPLAATAQPFSITLSSPGAADVVLEDMLVGVLLLCSGQSNLQLSIAMALNASAEIAALDGYGPTLRVLYAAGAASAAPLADLPAPQLPWQRVSAAGAGRASWKGFSATCFYTGRALWRALGSGAVPVGLVEAAVGGTAIRQWSPTEALARCPQPYNSPQPYGTAPYQHSTLYNAQIAPFGTGPTAFTAVLWDQAESDSSPQTPPEYYGCAGPALVAAWRALLQAPALPFVLQHLQPYGAPALEVLRSAQLAPLVLPATGYGSAMDLGDPASPLGAVHFRNKQAGAERLALALRAVAGLGDAAAAAAAYPPPQFLAQATWLGAAGGGGGSGGAPEFVVDVQFFRVSGGPALPLTLAPPPPCPQGFNCSGLELAGSDGALYPATNVTLTAGGLALRLSALGRNGTYPVGSRNCWSEWPLPVLYAGDPPLPVLPWSQMNVRALPGGARRARRGVGGAPPPLPFLSAPPPPALCSPTLPARADHGGRAAPAPRAASLGEGRRGTYWTAAARAIAWRVEKKNALIE